jgi:hypothetical protein
MKPFNSTDSKSVDVSELDAPNMASQMKPPNSTSSKSVDMSKLQPPSLNDEFVCSSKLSVDPNVKLRVKIKSQTGDKFDDRMPFIGADYQPLIRFQNNKMMLLPQSNRLSTLTTECQ